MMSAASDLSSLDNELLEPLKSSSIGNPIRIRI